MQIVSVSGKLLYTGPDTATTVRATVEAAVAAKVVLYGANLEGANLEGAYLKGANLKGANLKGANLYGANLKGANLERAYLKGANLYGANLKGAYLERAYLEGANLYGANLEGAGFHDTTVIDTGETWKQYNEEVVPALLTAGGKRLAAVVKRGWECHSWTNCPMAVAFDTEAISGVPILLRARANQFIKFFDSKVLPKPITGKRKPKAD